MTRASDTAKLLGAGATILDGTTISTADNTSQLILTSTDADSSSGGILEIARDSASPADGDAIGQIKFTADNDAGQSTLYGTINGTLRDASDGTEDGQMQFNTMVNGTNSDFFRYGVGGDGEIGVIFNEGSIDADFRVESNGNANMLFVDGGNDAVVIGQSAPDTTVIGTTPPFQVIGSGGNSFITVTNRQASDSGPHLALTKSRNTSVGSHTIVQSGDTVGAIVFQADDGTNLDSRAAEIRCKIDTTPGENDVPGRLEFLTTADGANSPTEHMRIDDGGQVFFGCTSTSGGVPNEDGSVIQPNGNQKFRAQSNGNAVNQFYNGDGTLVGSITAGSSSTAFNTSSDYRLKESVTYDFNATSRLKQLKPCRFNFIADKDKTVDGFIAHEVSSIVPEAVNGEKDAMMSAEVLYVDGDEIPDGKKVGDVKTAAQIKPQGIDQSKLVPLLVKTIQELEARITTLENA